MTEEAAYGAVLSFARALATNRKLSREVVARILRRCADALEAR